MDKIFNKAWKGYLKEREKDIKETEYVEEGVMFTNRRSPDNLFFAGRVDNTYGVACLVSTRLDETSVLKKVVRNDAVLKTYGEGFCIKRVPEEDATVICVTMEHTTAKALIEITDVLVNLSCTMGFISNFFIE